jgi:hypothetical protein
MATTAVCTSSRTSPGPAPSDAAKLCPSGPTPLPFAPKIGIGIDLTSNLLWKNGTTYNSFLIRGEKVALIDTSHEKFRQLYLDCLQGILDPAQIDYLVVSHTEPDHSGPGWGSAGAGAPDDGGGLQGGGAISGRSGASAPSSGWW